jgi:nanoRNase/pAp phosphatase (c-di-AMP/oligoRNAs hydrolase)
MDVETAHQRLDRIVGTFRGKERFLVQTHNNPDPDSIASAMAVRYLVQRYTGRDAVIAFGGVVGRSENRAMVRQLEIAMVPGSLVDYSAYDFTAVCDTQPGTNYTSFPDDHIPTLVIDHHDPVRPMTEKAEYFIVQSGYGATSSLMAELLLARDLPIPTDVATALYYGIKSETQDLCRDTSEVDEEVYRALAKLADRKLVSRIENEKVPRGYFREVRRAIANARKFGTLVATDLGKVSVPEMVAEMADFLMRLQGANHTFVMGECQKQIHLSMRSDDEDANCGDAMHALIEGIGSGGGHPSMAGGQVRLEGVSEDEKAPIKEKLVRRWCELSGGDDTAEEPLVPDDD